MLRVIASHGSPTEFFVESAELQCTNPSCSKLYKRTPPDLVRFSAKQQVVLRALGVWGKVARHLAALDAAWTPKYRVGDQCGRCGAALDVRFHTVHIDEFSLNGQCSCEWFRFTAAPKLSRMDPALQGLGEWRCHHISFAREFALDVALRAHWFQRHRSGEREEDAA